ASVAEQHRDVFVGLLVARPQQEVGGGRRRVRERAVGGELRPGRLEVDAIAQVFEGVEQGGSNVVDQPWWDMPDLRVPLGGDSHKARVGKRQLTSPRLVEQRGKHKLEAGQIRAGLPVPGVLVNKAQRGRSRLVSGPILQALRQIGQRHQRAQGRDQLVLGNRERGAEAAVRVLAAQQKAQRLRVSQGVRIVRRPQSSRKGRVVGGRGDGPLLERCQQTLDGRRYRH